MGKHRQKFVLALVKFCQRFGLFVRLADLGAEGLIPIRALGGDYFHHDERRQALVGQRTRLTYQMGDALAVKLMEAAPLTGGLRFELADAGPSRVSKKPASGRPERPSGKARFRGKKR